MKKAGNACCEFELRVILMWKLDFWNCDFIDEVKEFIV